MSNEGMSAPPTPSFPWRNADRTATTASSSSDLLKRVKDFLPQIQAANVNATTTGRRLDQGLVVDNGKADNDSDDDVLQQADEDAGPVSKKLRTNDKSNDEVSDGESNTGPTIQLDLTLGVDANHPAMALLGKEDRGNHSSKCENAETTITENDGIQNVSKAEQAVQSLLNLPQAATTTVKAKGPLITEVNED